MEAITHMRYKLTPHLLLALRQQLLNELPRDDVTTPSHHRVLGRVEFLYDEQECSCTLRGVQVLEDVEELL